MGRRQEISKPATRITIKNIARRAGVTTTTVSRALNDKPDISPETKARILAIAEEIGYTPSAIARSLVTQRTHTIGLAVRTISDMWVVEIVPAIEEVAREAGYEVFLSTHYFDADQEAQVVNTFRARQVDGMIVISSVMGEEYSTLQLERHTPIVLISPLMSTTHRYVVQPDDIGGAQLATSHLISLGHRRIGHIGAPFQIRPGQDRLEGYRRALQVQGIAYDPSLVVMGDGHEKGGLEGMRALMSLPHRPTAVFCFNDLTAIGALATARSMGLRVPQDVSVVGFDDVSLARYVNPPLSTVRQDMYEIGRRASQMLLDLIAGRDTEAPIILETQLVERESSARHGTTSVTG